MSDEPGSTAPTHAELILTARSEATLLQTYPDFVSQSVSDSPLVVVTAALTPERVLSCCRSAFETLPSNVGIITLGDDTRSAAVATTPQPPTCEPVPVATVAAPANVGRLGTLIDLYLREWGEHTTIAVCSLSSLIEHAPDRAVFRVLHLLTTQLRALGATGHFFCDPTIVDQTTVKTLEPLFDDCVGDRQPAVVQQAGQAACDDALTAPIRRQIVVSLREQSEPVPIRDLAVPLVRQADQDLDIAGLDADRVYQLLHHLHIPILVEAGLVVTDTAHERVEATRAAEQVDVL